MLCYHSHSGTAWTKISGQWCRRGATFSKLALAQASCLQLGTSCHGVYDDRCDGRAFHLCRTSHSSTSNSEGCVYQPINGISRVLSTSSTSFTAKTGKELKSAVQEYLEDSPTGECAEASTTTSVYDSYVENAVGTYPCTRDQTSLLLPWN